MPNFHAAFERASNLVGDMYGLDIMPPASRGQVDYRLTAYIAEDLPDTYLAESLAREFGARSEGDEIELTIRQRSHQTLRIHAFDPIPVCVGFAAARLGENYIQIGLDDLQRFFEVSLYMPTPGNPSPEFLFFEPLLQYRHWCRELT